MTDGAHKPAPKRSTRSTNRAGAKAHKKRGAGGKSPRGSAAADTPAAKTKPDAAKGTETQAEGPATEPSFPIVGIGASAGGLEAFTELLAQLPVDTGMGFVLIQHLDPKHESMLPSLLDKAAAMPVVQATDGQVVQADHVYVIPPNTNLGILRGALTLMSRGHPTEQHLPVDYFLRTLAEDRGAHAIGIILSGTASDGVLGLKAIKAVGGVTFAQDPLSARYDGMPRSAIGAGCVDSVLSVGDIAKELMHIAAHPYMVRPAAPTELPPDIDQYLSKIFVLLRSRTGNDFSGYKHSTIKRRIKRRMLLNKLETLKDYVRLLQEMPGELDALFQDVLITVTGFFRDPETFDALKRTVFPRILEGRAADAPIRIWVVGCSSGEEAYSVAIALWEFLGEKAPEIPIQLFATDIDARSIEKARAGVYPDSISQDVTRTRLKRFFVRVPQGYQISKAIRDMCVFAVQNVIKDPPFSKVDLICCRNLLIYLGAGLQKKTLRLFHYALIPGGFLMLSTSETVGRHDDLFALVDKKNRIHRRKTAPTPAPQAFRAGTYVPPVRVERDPGLSRAAAPIDIPRQADRIVLDRYGSAGVIIDQKLEIRDFRGQTGLYIDPAPGAASLDLVKMAHRDLRVALHTVVHKAVTQGASARKEGVKLTHHGERKTVNIQVVPLQEKPVAEPHFLVLFEEAPSPGPPAPGSPKRAGKGAPNEVDRRVEALEEQLVADREYLQSVIEEQEATNEELQSANEEIQSANEELQSTNEELETAREELQSTNEELATVNEELETRNLELTQVNSDLTNLLASVDLPILMLGDDLHIRHYTPQAQQLLNLIASDVGRPITDIRPKFDLPDLGKLTLDVIESVAPSSVELQGPDGCWYLLNLRPYKSLDNRIAGAVLVFIDVTALKDLKRERRLATVVRDSNDAITVQDFSGRILAWNSRATRLYGYTETEALAMNIAEIVPPDLHQQSEDFRQRLRLGETVAPFETRRVAKDGCELDIWLTASLLVNNAGVPTAIATTERENAKR